MRPGRSERGSGRKTGARLLAGHLTLDIPDVEAGDMKPNRAASRVEILDHRLGVGHGLAAAVAGLPGARAAPGARDGSGWQASIGELFLNQETKERLLHDGLLRTGSPLCGVHAGSTSKTYAGAMCLMFRTSAAGRGVIPSGQ